MLPCSTNPCQNGGTCANKGSVFSCACGLAATGARCETVLATLDPTPAPSLDLSRDASSFPTAAVAGGACGGLVFLALLVAMLIVRRRRHSSRKPLGLAGEPRLGLFTNPVFAPSNGTATGSLGSANEKNDAVTYSLPAYGTVSRGSTAASAIAAIKAELEQSASTGPQADYVVSVGYSSVLTAPDSGATAAQGTAAHSLLDVRRDSVELGARIGGGQFGDVYLATVKSDAAANGATLAAKVVKAGSAASATADLVAEEALMRATPRHGNVVALVGSLFEQEPYIMLLELMELGDLRSLLRWSRPTADLPLRLCPRQILSFLQDAARGLEFLASHHLVSVKPCHLAGGPQW